jgi:hypothetical protein
VNYFTIEQAAERLMMSKSQLEWWHYNKYNPLEVISGIKLEKINGRRVIPENVLEKYEEFISTHFTCEQAASFLGWDPVTMQVWVSNQIRNNRRSNRKSIRVKKVGSTHYVHKDDILPLQTQRLDTTNCLSTKEIMSELKINKSTVLDAIHNNHISGGFRVKGSYYAPRKSVDEYKNKYFKIESFNDYYSIGEAAEILGCTTRSLRTMIRSPKIELTAVKYKFKNSYYLLKSDVHNYKQFLDEIPHKYYTINQIMEKFNVSRPFVHNYLAGQLRNEVKWIVFTQTFERIIRIELFEAFYAAFDKYRVEKTVDPHSIVKDGTSLINVPAHLSVTKKVFLEYVSLKLNTSRASKQVQRMFAREYVFLYQAIMNLEKELSTFNDAEIKWLLRTTTNTNIKKNLIAFLTYLQDQMPTNFLEKYRVAEKPKGNRNKEIYSLDEFIRIEQHLKNIEQHILEALKDRRYAVTWLYTSLHLTNAWRSSDFLRLPTVDISLINVHDFQWFYDGNRLTAEQSQRIVNQYAFTRLTVSKTGVLNRFLINQDMLIPIATMIVICELHRQKENEQFLLLASGKAVYTLIKKHVSSVFPNSLRFGSMKMNRSFMTHLFHEATENTESLGAALQLVQQTRRHTSQDSTAIYIESTNSDGPLGNVAVNLCNRGHFGYLYNLLIERAYALTEKENNDSLNERTLKIQEYRTLFSTPYELEKFGEYIQGQVEERESLAVRVSLMTKEEAATVIK